MICNQCRFILSKIDPNAEVYLFGSRACGSESFDSDRDILMPLGLLDVDIKQSGLE